MLQQTGFPTISPEIFYAAAVVLAALIGFSARFGVNWVQKKNQRRKLRAALKSEINSVGWIENYKTEHQRVFSDEEYLPPTTHLPSEVYDSLTQEIGLLSTPEIEAIVRYYYVVHAAQEQLTILRNPEVDNGNTRDVFTNITIEVLVVERKTALAELNKRLPSDSSLDEDPPFSPQYFSPEASFDEYSVDHNDK